jgi:hypothetical protein
VLAPYVPRAAMVRSRSAPDDARPKRPSRYSDESAMTRETVEDTDL